MSSTSTWRDFFLRVFWHGGSTFDAWLNISAAKIASRILTAPQTAAQLGLPSAIALGLLQGALGLWAQFTISFLYLKYKSQQQAQPQDEVHVTQLHEVIGGLLGLRWKAISMLINMMLMFNVSFLQLVSSSNIVHLITKSHDKRRWTTVFAAIFSLSIFIPSAHNYRVWSFVGVITMIFTAIYLTVSSIVHGKEPDVQYLQPYSYRDFYAGVSGTTFIGHVFIPVEIMDAMWKPQDYNKSYFYGTVYVLLVTMVPSTAALLNFGSRSLLAASSTNALSLFPSSRFRDATVVLMLVHVFINFGMYSLALYATWEKFLRVHDSGSYWKRTMSRIPVFLALWITALALPFFGTMHKIVDSALSTWSLYIIPCAAYMKVFWSEESRKHSKPFTRLGWAADFSINFGIIVWVVIVEFSMGTWADVTILARESKGFQVFAKCYNC